MGFKSKAAITFSSNVPVELFLSSAVFESFFW